MDYNTEKIVKIINLYLMLGTSEISYIRNEVGKIIKRDLLSALDENDVENTEISELTLEVSKDCQNFAGKPDIICKQILSTAKDISNYNDKPLVSQLVCLWYIFSSGENDYQRKIIDGLKNQWKIKDDILAEMADTYATLVELKENSQKAISYVHEESFFSKMKNLFRKNKKPEIKKVVDDEYKNDEQVLLNSIKELFVTEAVRY